MDLTRSCGLLCISCSLFWSVSVDAIPVCATGMPAGGIDTRPHVSRVSRVVFSQVIGRWGHSVGQCTARTPQLRCRQEDVTVKRIRDKHRVGGSMYSVPTERPSHPPNSICTSIRSTTHHTYHVHSLVCLGARGSGGGCRPTYTCHACERKKKNSSSRGPLGARTPPVAHVYVCR